MVHTRLLFSGCRYYNFVAANGDVFLSNGSFGLVNILYNGTYGTVCDDFFDHNDKGCTVVCNQLNFP